MFILFLYATVVTVTLLGIRWFRRRRRFQLAAIATLPSISATPSYFLSPNPNPHRHPPPSHPPPPSRHLSKSGSRQGSSNMIATTRRPSRIATSPAELPMIPSPFTPGGSCGWPKATLILLGSIHAVIISGVSFLFRAQTRLNASYVCYGFLSLELASLGIMAFCSWEKDGNQRWIMGSVLMVLASMLGWPLVSAFLDTLQSTHMIGLLIWGGLSCASIHLVLPAVPYPVSIFCSDRNAILLLYWVAAMAGAARMCNWTQLSPTQEDWYLLMYVYIPASICSIYAQFGLTPNDFDQCQTTFCEEKSVFEAKIHSVGTGLGSGNLSSPIEPARSCVADLAHEVRTPLNALLSCCTLLADTPLTSEQLDFVNIMMTCGSQITNNINFVLDLAKLEQGKLILEHKPFDLRAICNESLRIVNHLAEQKHIKLELRGGSSDALVMLGDPSRLKQAMLNLLTNSIKFTDQGSVSIHIIEPFHTPHNPIPSSTSEKVSPKLRIEIIDTGIGMSEEQQKRLFQPFEQASSETYGKYGGTGLGLVISKQLIELMHGSIRIDSAKTAVGKGSTFVIELPMPPAVTPPSSRETCHSMPAVGTGGGPLYSDEDMNFFGREASSIAISLTPKHMTPSPRNQPLVQHRRSSHQPHRLGATRPGLTDSSSLALGLHSSTQSLHHHHQRSNPSIGPAPSLKIVVDHPGEDAMELTPVASTPRPLLVPPPLARARIPGLAVLASSSKGSVGSQMELSPTSGGGRLHVQHLQRRLSAASRISKSALYAYSHSGVGLSDLAMTGGAGGGAAVGAGAGLSESLVSGGGQTLNAFDHEQLNRFNFVEETGSDIVTRSNTVIVSPGGGDAISPGGVVAGAGATGGGAAASLNSGENSSGGGVGSGGGGGGGGGGGTSTSGAASFGSRQTTTLASPLGPPQKSTSTGLTNQEGFQRFQILSVDDNELNNRLMGKLLQSVGFVSVHMASNGEQALEYFRAHSVDIVITDIQMDGMSGLELASKIRQVVAEQELDAMAGGGGGGVNRTQRRSRSSFGLRTRRWPVIIALSGLEDHEVQALCIEAGIDVYLKKPINRLQLAETIANQLEFSVESGAPAVGNP